MLGGTVAWFRTRKPKKDWWAVSTSSADRGKPIVVDCILFPWEADRSSFFLRVVPRVPTPGDGGPLRCEMCRAYINSFAKYVQNGEKVCRQAVLCVLYSFLRHLHTCVVFFPVDDVMMMMMINIGTAYMFGGFALASRVQNHGPERACPATCVLPCLALPSSVVGSVNG